MSPDTPVTNRMCEERHHHYTEKVEEVHNDIKVIKKLLLGNGHMGIVGRQNIIWWVGSVLVGIAIWQIKIWLG